MSTVPDPGALLSPAGDGLAADGSGQRTARRGKVVLTRLRRNPWAVAGFAVLAFLTLLAYAGPLLYPWDHTDLDYTALQQPPGGSHWFGTDAAGADLFAVTMRGLQKSLLVGLLTALVCTTVATAVGTVAGYAGGWTDRVALALIGLFLVLPGFLLVAVMSTLVDETTWLLLVVLLAALSWMITGRAVRNTTRSLKQHDFVRAAVCLGVPGHTVVRRHVVPALASFLIIDATLQVGSAVIAEAGLAYFGFGFQPPDVSLGGVIASGTPYATVYPWLFYFPAGCLLSLCLSLFLIGDGLRAALDPASPRNRPGRTRRASRAAVAADVPRTALQPASGAPPALAVRDLRVSLPGEGGTVHAVRGISYEVLPGEVVAIVGESGAGKSVSAAAIMGLLPETAEVAGSVRLAGRELIGLEESHLCRVRGDALSMVFQHSLTSLTPVYSVGYQITEALRAHRRLDRATARQRAVELLTAVGIPEPARTIHAFPHECSGGMRQRVAIAMAIANDPKVIIADEPTTALDVTTQAQILDVLKTARTLTGAALVIITHDLALVAGVADRVHVMYAGRFVEEGSVDDVFARPRMPYTIGLLGAVPRADLDQSALTPVEGTPPSPLLLPDGCPFVLRCPLAADVCRDGEPALRTRGNVTHPTACVRSDEFEREDGLDPARVFSVPRTGRRTEIERRKRAERPVLLEVDHLVRHFPVYRGTVLRRRVGTVTAVDDVSLDVREKETLALVGESGSGKSTLLNEIADPRKTLDPGAGRVLIAGRDIHRMTRRQRRRVCRDVQLVLQDPVASLDPRLSIGDILGEPLLTHGWPRDHIGLRISELLDLVGLDAAHADRFPRELSGGQAQRVNIARALALKPRLLLLDEPVSALDVSVQASVLNLLRTLKAELSLSCLLVTHDLAVARYLADRVAVMHLGRIVELAPAASVFAQPSHPYTHVLLSAAPLPEPQRERARQRVPLLGEPLDPAAVPTGCRFRSRCPRYLELSPGERRRCEDQDPDLLGVAEDHAAACHFAGPPRGNA
ncbi:dipeptide ABC transporter ATP-binding protein [Streptomyces sp. ISL-22]|uniref:dipeptide ABC transporter ATP-binding protein n=1 Tax=unclassified Streptomyces TaxID=2593676 RepID=UPI001BEA4791|nr:MULTISPECIES: dipeptide ABC transporter ATP-binding protein [unclassified Streptomyces]MBT2418882.1 dipeptide ABC transporter ATP-binding protein [Streptomyces sp. ISL-24]MBT2435685.1 dipeptide ABC transporter ATP-binding protein [Streptomyces sp. ISL-22]